MLETITLDNAIKFFTPLAKNLYDEKIKPLVKDRIAGYLRNTYDVISFERECVSYISRASGMCSTINTIAFPNSPKKIDDLYIPLEIKDEKNNKVLIDSEVDVFEKSKRILVSDTAGMGKSTLSKRIFLNVVKAKDFVPVYIELRQLSNECIATQVVAKFGVSTLNPIDFLKKLPLVFIFDGLDEVATENKELVIKGIRRFVDNLGDPRILITSRLESYLSEFYDFTRFTITPLDESEAFKLIEKYDPNGDVSPKLISGIQRSKDTSLKEFLTTPLYVSLLFCAYRYKTVIPQKKHLFYSQVFDALFESHDLSKEINFVRPKNSNLDSSEFHLLLRRLGFWCLKNGGKIEFQKDQLEIVVKDIISSTSGINTSAVNFVKDLSTTVPLFIKEGSSLRWSHKSLMEYFASMFICNDVKNKQEELLLYFYNSESWASYKNIFELCADIEFTSLRASVVKKVLGDFVLYHDIFHKNIKNRRIRAEDIERRIGLSFGRVVGFKFFEFDSANIQNEYIFGSNNPDVLKVVRLCNGSSFETSQLISFISDELVFNRIEVSTREKMVVDIIKYKLPHLFLSSQRGRLFDFSRFFFRSSIKKNKLYIVTDSPVDPMNNSKNFHMVNFLLSREQEAPLDYSKIITELSVIAGDCSNGIDQLIGELG